MRAPTGMKSKITDNIFLVGLMGAGKSTIGRRLAQELGRQFRDSDNEIENKTGVSIDVIFDIEGEQGFRRRETGMLKELVGERGIVLATGGGAALAPENRELLRDNGLVIYLKASAERLAGRVRLDRHRPLLRSGDKLERMRELMIERDPIYQQLADVVVETNNSSVPCVVREISKMIKKHETTGR